MKRHGVFVAALLVLPLTAFALHQPGWCGPDAARRAPEQRKTRDERLSEAAWRWRGCQPHHWRDCLLQR
jgi:hypothetical protein